MPATELLREALYRVVHQQPLDDMAIPEGMEEIATSQSEIGWNQMLKGRFSILWKQHHQQHLGTNATKKKNGNTWVVSLASFMFQQWWLLWESRNQDRHGRDQQTAAQAQQRQAIRELEFLWQAHPTDKKPGHEHIFSDTLDAMKQWTLRRQLMWLNLFKPVIEEWYSDRLQTR